MSLIIFTTVYHDLRLDLGITNDEYIVCDIIYQMSANKTSKIPGWFYANRDSLAEHMCLSKRTIVGIVNKMVDRGFLERDEQTSYLRTTEMWDEGYLVARGVQNLHGNRAKSARGGGAKSAPNEYNIYSLLIDEYKDEEYSSIEGASKELYNDFKSLFMDFYKSKINDDYYFSGGKDGAKIKSILQKVVFKMKSKSNKDLFTKKEIIDAASVFLNAAWETGNDWVKSNFSLSNIDSKFNDLFAQIKLKSNGQIAKGKPISRFHENAI